MKRKKEVSIGAMKTERKPHRRNDYVYGNLAVKPERRKRTLQEKLKHKNQVRRNQEKQLQMNAGYVFMFSVAMIITLFICVDYLQLRASISSRIKRIEQLQLEVEELITENDTAQLHIESSVNLDEVYEIATKELGMVHPSKEQILLYDKTELEYVKQNEDIPKH